MNAFNFHRQLTQSEPAVERVVQWLRTQPTIYHAEDVQHVSALYYQGDFYFVPTTALQYVELKCESRSSEQTPNLAVERYSNEQRQTIGGPWSTRAHWYAHFYSDGLLVMMNRSALTVWLTPRLRDYPPFSANNGRYVTSGVLVPRADVLAALQNNYREYRVTA